jgi:hypothetical protein
MKKLLCHRPDPPSCQQAPETAIPYVPGGCRATGAAG